MTPAEQAYQEQLETIRKAREAGVPTAHPASNRARVNNTDAERVDSQGIAGSLARRAVPDVTFNQSTYDVLERYDEFDRLAEVEQAKREGKISVEKPVIHDPDKWF
ncbi:MAG: hypothetical protein M3406_15430 [Chloroflexota bacterium]|nr:hypothetical protein [Chloroflexota bacterium]